MKPILLAWSIRTVPTVLAALICLPVPAANALLDRKACQALEQGYAQIERGASPIEVSNMLFSAADKGCEALAVLVLDKGASLEARDRFGANPLSHAAAAGHADLVTLFLDRGAAIDARNIDGSSALYKAAAGGRPEIVELLVARGANVNLPGRSDISPLSAAAFMGSEPIVAFLIDQGADLNAIDKTQKLSLIHI